MSTVSDVRQVKGKPSTERSSCRRGDELPRTNDPFNLKGKTMSSNTPVRMEATCRRGVGLNEPKSFPKGRERYHWTQEIPIVVLRTRGTG